MSISLPQLINKPVKVKIKGHFFEAKPLTLDDIAEIIEYNSQFAEEEHALGFMMIKEYIYSFYLCLKHCNPDITYEYVKEFVGAEQWDELVEAGKTLGFTVPQMINNSLQSPLSGGTSSELSQQKQDTHLSK